MKFSGKVYDILKWVCLIVLPAVTTFLLTVLPVLNVDPQTIKIVVTVLSAIGVLIGSLIGVSTVSYYKDK